MKLTRRAKIYLDSLATLGGKSAYTVLEEAFWHYFETGLAEDKQKVVKDFADAALAEQQGKEKPKS